MNDDTHERERRAWCTRQARHLYQYRLCSHLPDLIHLYTQRVIIKKNIFILFFVFFRLGIFVSLYRSPAYRRLRRRCFRGCPLQCVASISVSAMNMPALPFAGSCVRDAYCLSHSPSLSNTHDFSLVELLLALDAFPRAMQSKYCVLAKNA